MKNYGSKLLMLLLLATSLGFIGLSNITANITADEVIKTSDGNHYFIAYSDEAGYHARQFSSLAALKSYRFLSSATIKNNNLDALDVWESYTIGVRDGVVTCATQTFGTDKAGECSLIFNNIKHPFASEQVFINSGFSFERAMFLDTNSLVRGSAITNIQQTRKAGTLINDNGTIKLITSSYTTSGIPSLAVLNSWGWDVKDALPATATDKLLVQIDILGTREAGEIDSPTIADDEVAEGVLMLHMLSKYPDQPRNVAVNQDAAGEVLAFHNELSNLESHEIRAYLSDYSLQLYDALPSISSASMTETLVDSVYRNANATILGVGNNATVKQEILQPATNYRTQVTVAYKKENGIWKIDLAESLKLEFQGFLTDMPDLGGSGVGDLRIVSVKVEQSIGSGANNLIIEIGNSGNSEAFSYGVTASINGTSLIKKGISTSYYRLKPGESVKIRIPFIHLEQLGLASGMYNLVVAVYPMNFEDSNYANNEVALNTQLNQSFASKIQ